MLHEIKFDGYRVQLHKVAKDVVIYSRRGADFTKRYQPIADALVKLPVRSAIIDAPNSSSRWRRTARPGAGIHHPPS